MYFLILVIGINSFSGTYVLFSLRGHLRGAHILIFALTVLIVPESSILLVKYPKILEFTC